MEEDIKKFNISKISIITMIMVGIMGTTAFAYNYGGINYTLEYYQTDYGTAPYYTTPGGRNRAIVDVINNASMLNSTYYVHERRTAWYEPNEGLSGWWGRGVSAVSRSLPNGTDLRMNQTSSDKCPYSGRMLL